jgi:Serine incorporator (Serinc)
MSTFFRAVKISSQYYRQVLKAIEGDPGKEPDFYIGRSKPAMWMRVVSSWVCMVLYIWSLVAPVLMPDRSVKLKYPYT